MNLNTSNQMYVIAFVNTLLETDSLSPRKLIKTSYIVLVLVCLAYTQAGYNIICHHISVNRYVICCRIVKCSIEVFVELMLIINTIDCWYMHLMGAVLGAVDQSDCRWVWGWYGVCCVLGFLVTLS